MVNIKYSRQRASIKKYLDQTYEHPTADTVYLHVREEFPHISLGTVYRNLNLLADIGEIRKITTPNRADRFDGRTAPHYHVVCDQCGAVSDLLLDEEYIHSVDAYASRHFDGTITYHDTLFHGICAKCKANEKAHPDSTI